MSFKEKLSGFALVNIVLVWGFYFTRLAQLSAEGTLTADRSLWLLIGCIVVLLIGYIIGAIAAARSGPQSDILVRDEREQAIALKASNAAFIILGAVLGGLSGFAYVHSVKHPDLLGVEPLSTAALVAVNGVVLALAVAEAVRHLVAVVLSRRGR
ncbi:hypothetical protein [Brevundimonas sp.]|uniref:hypothetical protein n=1 Tax=Brevundimonas sp. TaxID=1871086 RepID=UPI0024874764|nr:hypothetical protein [Brevundimonas sp.]MDI1281497.1 hypothetical protein [Brevundimonas sp.]